MEQVPNIIKYLMNLREKFYTSSAKEIAKGRLVFMEKFLKQLSEELITQK